MPHTCLEDKTRVDHIAESPPELASVKHHHALASIVTMETPSRQPPLWRCVLRSSAGQQISPPRHKELEGSILGFAGHTISVEITVP